MKLNNEQSFYGHIYETKISDLKSSKEKFGKKILKKNWIPTRFQKNISKLKTLFQNMEFQHNGRGIIKNHKMER